MSSQTLLHRTFYHWVQFSSVSQLCLTLCDPMNRRTPGLPVHQQPLEFNQIHIHRISDAIQPSHPLSSPSPPAPNPSQHQSFPMSQLFMWGGQSTGVSALASFLPKNTQGWCLSEWTGSRSSSKEFQDVIEFLIFWQRSYERQIRAFYWRTFLMCKNENKYQED